MKVEFIPLISFVVITTFTPGPNNISSASMGVMLGYNRSLNYLLGIAAGFFFVMLACAFLASALLSILPHAERYLRWIGALYILWLAIGNLRSSYSFSDTGAGDHAFSKGFVLQLFNPKVAVYGMTIYSTFLSAVADNPTYLTFFAAALALTAFAATSTWTVAGAAIKRKLKNDRFRKAVNAILSILLIYAAFDLSNIADCL